MKTETKPFYAGDLPAVCDFLHEMEPSRSSTNWRKAIIPNWPWAGQSFGQMLIVDDVLSGVCCQLKCQRRYGGNVRIGCNIASWYVRPELQGKGLGVQLLNAALSDEPWVYTNQTPEPYTINAFKRAGFQVIDTTEWVIPNLPRWDLGNFVEIDEIGRHLSGEALENYQAHARLPNVGHIGLMGPEKTFCHIAFVRGRWHKLPVARIIYSSNYDVLAQFIPAFSKIALTRYHLPLTALEKRRAVNRPFMAIAERWRDPILYRGAGILADQIDSLFCEVVTVAPDV